MMKLYAKDKSILLLHNPFYIYAENANSLTNSTFTEKNLVFIDILYNRLISFKYDNFDKLHINTFKLYCNIVIEYYFKIKN